MPDTKLLLSGGVTAILTIILRIIQYILTRAECIFTSNNEVFNTLIYFCNNLIVISFTLTILLLIFTLIIHFFLPPVKRIECMVKKGLFAYQCGNPLHFKDGEILPQIKCKKLDMATYELTITAITSTVEDIQKLSSSISSAINLRKFKQYAVTQTDTDIAFNQVTFTIEDVTVHRELIVSSVDELKSDLSTRLTVQQGTEIDLTTSGSILVAGKTRSGKTTAIISLLLQALSFGKDNYNSQVMIIDPKQAELSRLPHVYTLDEDGEARQILEALKTYADCVVQRQKVLNELSEKKGDAVHWWEAGFHVSFLFIDEYVACRTLFPKKAVKGSEEYTLATFDGLLKRLVTMGASAGCYVILSVAEASVEEGGLPSMLRSAMSTKILFKPTLNEGRLMWDSDKLKDFSERVYNAGDAWFSSTDGIHDRVSYVHFPIMNFAVYKELGRLLEEYYK